jgi:large subunit ribosomal protein L35
MPKQKTNRAAAKRFKLTGSGRVKRAQSGLRHGMIGKPRSRKRRIGGTTLVSKVDEPRALRMLGKR